MDAGDNQRGRHDGGVEMGETLPATSPLHAIPGFDRLSRRKLYPKGSVLLVEGQWPRGVYVLCAGRAKLSITSAAGRKLIVRVARSGDLLGIQATLAGNACEATAETLTPCQIDFISRTDLLDLLAREGSSNLKLAIAISKEFTEFFERARVLLLSVAAEERLAELLLAWAESFGRPTTLGIHLRTSLTHEELGQMIGASRETVTRALNVLKRREVIRATNGDIWIRDRVALAVLAKAAR
jgi:CRP/FNR family transcriptional regulator